MAGKRTLMSCLCALAVLGVFAAQARAVDRGTEINLRAEIGRLWRRGPGGLTWACTGTLVAPDFVLTAAHCIGYSSEHPEQYFFGIDSSSGFMMYQVAQIWNFGAQRTWGDYVPNEDELKAVPRSATPSERGNNDVALLQLTASVPPDIATPSGVATWYIDASATVSLFGYGDGLCHGTYARGAGVKRVNTWTYQVNGGKNSQRLDPTGIICDGDSGGPGVLGGPADGGAVWGVASSTSSSWDEYGDVVYFRPWMEQIVTGMPQPEYRKDRGNPSEWLWAKLR
jgi:Trypsin